MTIWNLYDKAVVEVDADRQNRINEAYIVKLEDRIKQLELQPVGEDRIKDFVAMLNGMAGLRDQTFWKIKIVRAAFNLGLKEAKDAVEMRMWSPADESPADEATDDYDDLPF